MKKIIFTLLVASSFLITGQEKEEKKFTLNGSVDAYFKTNLSSTDQAIFGDNQDSFQSFGTSFANKTGFAIGMVNLIAGYEGEKTGFVADVAFGPRALEAVGGDDGVFVNQLYAYWNVSEKTKLTIGRFNTYLGYEVISPTGNFNYTTSYMFSNGPFSHVGLKADFTLSEDFSLMLAIMNPTDTNNNLTGDYGFGAQLGYKGQYLNFYYDSDVVLGFEVDYTGGFDVTDDFFLGINAAYQVKGDLYDDNGDIIGADVSNGFYGVALYPQYKTSDSFSLGLRGELFGYHLDGGSDLASVFSTTLTGSYVINNLTIKPEIRLDSWNNGEPYFDNDLNASSNLSAFAIAAIYSF
jgi:hypothetical protein